MIVNLSKKLFEKLKKKTYRDAYVAENARTGIAYQIRAMREQRSMQQGSLASKLGKPQSVVSRLENPDYGKYTLSSLLEIASAFDVALVVRFVNYPEFIRQTRNVSPSDLEVDSFDVGAFFMTMSGDVGAETGPGNSTLISRGFYTASTSTAPAPSRPQMVRLQ